MGARWLAVGGMAAALGLALASPASAATTISINPGNVPTTAAEYEQGCDFGDGPYADKDVWVFVLPGNKGTFLSVTAKFDTPGGAKALTIPTDGGAIDNTKGTSKAWIATPAGWTLTDASASIDGTTPKDSFNLTHTCKASGGSTPSPSPSVSASVSPSSSVSPSASTSPSGSASPGAGAGGGGDNGDLPVTGASITGLAVFGGALVAAGTVLALRRRRAVAFSSEGGE